jgi:hypothetical protein
MKIKITLLVWLFILAFAAVSFAAIDITDRTGTVQITMPDGTSVTVAANQPLPAIPDGATITMISGNANITTTGSSAVTVSIAGATVQVNSAATVSMILNQDGSVSITAVSGQASVTNHGTTVTIGSNNPTYRFTPVEPYMNPIPDVTPEVETGAVNEDSARDISPMK